MLGRGPWGLGYAGIYALATAPGLPLGFALFGRRHALGWASGALIGYGLTATMLAVLIKVGLGVFWAFLCGWIVLGLVAWLVASPMRSALIPLPAWRRQDSFALLAVLLLVPALMGPPYVKVGAADAQGTRYYRAYFTADYIWHGALVQQLSRFELPPKNPYLNGHRLHYYWTYFMVPAAVVGTLPDAPLGDYELCLKVNAYATAHLFVAVLFLAAWSVVARGWFAAAATALGLLAVSAEGTYVLIDLWRRGLPIGEVRHLNIDAITMWFFRGLTMDGLPRSMWYNPQHSLAAALGLVGAVVAGRRRLRSPFDGAVLVGLVLGLAVAASPVPGMSFVAIYGLGSLAAALAQRRPLRVEMVRVAVAAVPVAIALVWCYVNAVFEGAGGALRFGFLGQARSHPVLTLLLAAGPGLTLALISLVPPWRLPGRLLPFVMGVAMALVMFYLVSLQVDAMYFAFRAGQILFLCLPALLIWFLARGWRSRPRRIPTLALALTVLAVGLPTTAIDLFNAQDIANREMGPGFRWTIDVTPAEQSALRWVRATTGVDALVQTDAMARGRETWSWIPTFAGRRMAVGVPLPLLHTPEYDRRMELVQKLYATPDAQEACRLARGLGIDYLYIGRAERAAHPPDALAKFWESSCFAPVFRNVDAAVVQVVAEQR